MGVDVLLSRLENVRGGRGQWRARCPAHERNPRGSDLSITEKPGGMVLVNCHAGCGYEAIVIAVGLSASVLLPPRSVSGYVPRGLRPVIDPREVLRAAHEELLVGATILSSHRDEECLTPHERERLWLAAGRVARAAEVANG